MGGWVVTQRSPTATKGGGGARGALAMEWLLAQDSSTVHPTLHLHVSGSYSATKHGITEEMWLIMKG